MTEEQEKELARLRERNAYLEARLAALQAEAALENWGTVQDMLRISEEDGPPVALQMSLADIGLSFQVYNLLVFKGIRDIPTLCRHSEVDLMRLGRFGPKTRTAIKKALQKVGLSLAG